MNIESIFPSDASNSRPFFQLSNVSPGNPIINSVYVGILCSLNVSVSVENLSNLIFSLFTSCKVVSSKDCKATVTARSRFALCSSLANGIILSEENFAQDSRTRCGNPVFNEVSLNFFASFRSFSLKIPKFASHVST